MKIVKKLIVGALLSPSLLTLQAAYPDLVKADQPVGYWRLGDASGAATAVNSGSLGATGNGTPINNVTFGVPGALNGDADTAVNLDGAAAKIEVPFAPELNPAIFTIEAWAKTAPDSAGVHRSPLASRDDFPQRGYIFYADPADNWQFWTGAGSGWDNLGGASVEPYVWAHLVGVYDGTNKFFYVNGVLVGANQSPLALNTARLLRIGGSATESAVGDFFFNGDIDEVAVYNKALSADRVLAHYNGGSATPASADIPPAIAVQLAPLNRFKNESATLTALATGSLPLTYQWKKDDVDIPNATGMTLTLNNLQPGDSGMYTFVVHNSAGDITSDPAELQVADVTKPVITSQPRSVTVFPGNKATFSVAASGSTTFTYQWQLNGQNLPGETQSTLTINNTAASNLGNYAVVVTNPAGSTTSDPATLKFPAPATKSYSETVKEDAPAAYWRLGELEGEIADDEIGTNDGTYLNGVILGQPGAPVGDPNKAAGFVAANQTKVDVAWSDVINPPVFTVECWAKVTGGSGHRSPLTSRSDFPQRGYIFYAEPGNTWQFWVGTPGGWAQIQGPAVQQNAYTHLVGLYDGTTLYFFVNGILAGQQAVEFSLNDQSPLRIGGGATEGDGNFFFEGDVDEVAVYPTALSDDRIIAHYVAAVPLTTPPTIATQPISQAAPPGATVSFTVAAAGIQPFTYQWKFKNQDISYGTNATLSVTNVTAANAGDYMVVVSNAGGDVSSAVATLTIPTPSTKTYVELVKADGPVGYWRLGESEGEIAKDEIDSNDGTYLNGVTLGVPGAIQKDPNTAANFVAAQSQKTDVPWTDVLNPPMFSVELWARVTASTGNYRSPLTSRADGPQRGYIFYADPGDNWQFWSGKGDTTGWDIIGNAPVETGKWTYLAATYDGTTKRFYVNGVLIGTSTAAFAPNDESVLRIGGGASEGDGNYFFEGDVDEPAVYNKALTHEQVILHYVAGAPATSGSTLHFTRDQGKLILSWDSGTLQSASAITGPWDTVPNATSPLTVTPSETARFYRVR